jgi:2-keto-4-pentenoate hydratase/2-oxohepta-3-ene-1,7-dioic acid hydratase in catechol pathway
MAYSELAVVIGKEGKNIPKEWAISHVAGYCISNDVSFRGIQFPEGWPKEPPHITRRGG